MLAREAIVMSNPPLFKSFWMAGYEGACHINESGKRLDMTSFVQHDRQVAQDYALLPGFGIEAARESVRRPLIGHSGQFDYSSIAPMLKAPELGGDPQYLDIIGVNYYHSNQWEYLTNDRLHWHLGDPRRMPLHQLLAEVHQRYRHPFFIGETSHVGSGRGLWIREIAEEVCIARSQGIPVDGICLYPILDRPDWENERHWHNSGLWDLETEGKGPWRRVLNENYAVDLKVAQNRLTQQTCNYQSIS
jgi:hypothetical protein